MGGWLIGVKDGLMNRLSEDRPEPLYEVMTQWPKKRHGGQQKPTKWLQRDEKSSQSKATCLKATQMACLFASHKIQQFNNYIC